MLRTLTLGLNPIIITFNINISITWNPRIYFWRGNAAVCLTGWIRPCCVGMGVWRVESGWVSVFSQMSVIHHQLRWRILGTEQSAAAHSAHYVHRHRRVRVRRTSPDTFRQCQTVPALELQSKVLEDFTIMEKAPTNFKCASGCFREGSFEALSGTAHREQSDGNISIDTWAHLRYTRSTPTHQLMWLEWELFMGLKQSYNKMWIRLKGNMNHWYITMSVVRI